MIDAVVFDFGNVLAKVNRSSVCGELAHYSKLTPSQICGKIFNTRVEQDSETGRLTAFQHYSSVRDLMDASSEFTYDRFEAAFCSGLCLLAGGIEALRFAVRSGLPSFVLSNISAVHLKWFQEQPELVTLPARFPFQ